MNDLKQHNGVSVLDWKTDRSIRYVSRA